MRIATDIKNLLKALRIPTMVRALLNDPLFSLAGFSTKQFIMRSVPSS
jgi:hypothetical protein